MKDIKAWWTAWKFVIVAAGVLIGLVLLIAFFLPPDVPEVLIGVVIVLAVGVLILLLFLMSAGFTQLNLSNPNEALGLPQGSVRALIALLLIMVFITFGLYLFRTMSGLDGPTLRGLTMDEVVGLQERVVSIQEATGGEEGKPKTFDVRLRLDVSESGGRLAQQLITTLGTLVVAVAGFYFGARAIAAARGPVVSAPPAIRRMDPEKGKYQEGGFPVEIHGKGFRLPKAVKLVQGSREIRTVGEPMASSTVIRCRLDLTKEDPPGKWDLIVMNEDGGEDRVDGLFTLEKT